MIIIMGILRIQFTYLSARGYTSLILSFEGFSLINTQTSLQMSRRKSTSSPSWGELLNVPSCLTMYMALVQSRQKVSLQY